MNDYEYRIHGTAVQRHWQTYMRCVTEERAREILAMLRQGTEVTEVTR